ncbi:MAG: holo-ACP synthase [Propionibacteriaceae bacterium]|jgi:holo-[acyl-carrier protein] synthase|nr:holo-ACP synthase [Propionibacteriaceae bacterium]
MIVGVGVDVVDLSRFERALARPGFAQKLFTAAELEDSPNTERLAGRFAAKEALAKALCADGSLAWRDAVVGVDSSGAPSFSCQGSVSARMKALGVEHLHLSISHDGGVAVAFVVASR